MQVRSLEPITSYTLTRLCGGRGATLTVASAIALLAVILGGATSVVSQPRLDVMGLLLGFGANFMFSSRTLLVTLMQDKLEQRVHLCVPPEKSHHVKLGRARLTSGIAVGRCNRSCRPTCPLPPRRLDSGRKSESNAIDPIGLFTTQHALGLLLIVPATRKPTRRLRNGWSHEMGSAWVLCACIRWVRPVGVQWAQWMQSHVVATHPLRAQCGWRGASARLGSSRPTRCPRC